MSSGTDSGSETDMDQGQSLKSGLHTSCLLFTSSRLQAQVNKDHPSKLLTDNIQHGGDQLLFNYKVMRISLEKPK